MWSDNSHGEGFSHGHTSHGQAFHHGQTFSHAPALDKLCLRSRLGCVLAGGVRGGGASPGGVKRAPSYMAQVQDPPTVPTATEVSVEAAIFVAVIVVFYAAIIVILLGTNMRRPRSSSSRPRRPRSRSRPRHQVVLDPRSGAVTTQHTHKKKKDSTSSIVQGAESV